MRRHQQQSGPAATRPIPAACGVGWLAPSSGWLVSPPLPGWCSSCTRAQPLRGALPLVGPRSWSGSRPPRQWRGVRCGAACAAPPLAAVCGMRAGRASPAHYAKAPVRIRARAGGPPVAVPAPGFVRPWWLCGPPGGSVVPSRVPVPLPRLSWLSWGLWGAPGGSVVLSVRPVGAGPSPCPPPRSSAPGVGVPPVWRLVALRGGSLVAPCLGPPRGLCPSGLLSCWWAVQTARSGRGPRSPATGALLPSQDIRGLEMVKGKPLRGPQSGPLTISNPLMQDKSQQAKQ